MGLGMDSVACGAVRRVVALGLTAREVAALGVLAGGVAVLGPCGGPSVPG